MQRLEVSGAVRPIYGSLGVKRLILHFYGLLGRKTLCCDSCFTAWTITTAVENTNTEQNETCYNNEETKHRNKFIPSF